MSIAVFTYGSLMFPPVWERVVEGQYRCAEALVEGYQRYEVRAETYPGMVRAVGQSMRGIVYLDVGARDLAALDAFEGEDYWREELTALLGNGERITVSAYLYLPAERLSEKIWEPKEFRLQQFLDTYCRARASTG